MKEIKNSINEERLFRKLPDFFAKTGTVLVELAQNAQRAEATSLNIRIENGVLSAYDNGEGCADPSALFVLASSGWSEEVETAQNPAGWGGLFLVCISESITYWSTFGSITFECDRYIESKSYRESILKHVDPTRTLQGFAIEAKLKPGVMERLNAGNFQKLRFFPLDMTVNGDLVEKSRLTEEAEKWPQGFLHLNYEGNALTVKITPLAEDLSMFSTHLALTWYGVPINTNYVESCDVCLEVTNGSPLTPVLPIRTGVKEDAKLEALHSFVREKLVEHSIAFINDAQQNKLADLLRCIEIVSKHGTQQQLDSLQRFSVSYSEPYHDHEGYFDSKRDEIIGRGELVPVNEFVESLVVNGAPFDINVESALEGSLVLPAETIVEVTTKPRKPSWLEIPERGFRIEVRTKSTHRTPYSYDWLDAEIICEGKVIQCLSIVEGWDDGVLVYSESPRDLDQILTAIFQRRLVSDDFEADSYETQRHSFEEEIEKQICRMRGTYRRTDLLDGFRTAGIKVGDIVGVRVRKKDMILKLSSGESVKLRLAA